MKKSLKMLVGGAILGGLGYLFLTDQRQITARVQNVERVISMGREILTMEMDPPVSGGMTKSEYVDTVATLFKELQTMSTVGDVNEVRLRIAVLADADPKWKTFSDVFNKGASTFV